MTVAASLFAGPGWRVSLPETVTDRIQPKPAPDTDITSMAIARGTIGNGEPATIIITVRPRAGRSAESFADGLLADMDDLTTKRQVTVAGGAAGVLVSARRYVEEGVVLDGYERVTLLVVPGGATLTTLAIRVPAEAEVDQAVKAIIASFEVLPA